MPTTVEQIEITTKTTNFCCKRIWAKELFILHDKRVINEHSNIIKILAYSWEICFRFLVDHIFLAIKIFAQKAQGGQKTKHCAQFELTKINY